MTASVVGGPFGVGVAIAVAGVGCVIGLIINACTSDEYYFKFTSFTLHVDGHNLGELPYDGTVHGPYSSIEQARSAIHNAVQDTDIPTSYIEKYSNYTRRTWYFNGVIYNQEGIIQETYHQPSI